MRKDSSGKVVYRRTIEGQSRWLSDNAIEITLEITENDACVLKQFCLRVSNLRQWFCVKTLRTVDAIYFA